MKNPILFLNKENKKNDENIIILKPIKIIIFEVKKDLEDKKNNNNESIFGDNVSDERKEEKKLEEKKVK